MPVKLNRATTDDNHFLTSASSLRLFARRSYLLISIYPEKKLMVCLVSHVAYVYFVSASKYHAAKTLRDSG